MNYQQTKEHLFKLRFAKTKYHLETMRRVTKIFGNPEKQFKTILVGGTNGKGSTSTFIFNILQEAGYRVGIFNSPFILEPTELIRVGKANITQKEFVEYTNLISIKVDFNLSYFEYMTMIALLFFRDLRVDFGVLEIGLGGRLDATNIVDPLISIITHISQDHTDILGKTLVEIAKEKAGIIRKNGVLISAEKRKSLMNIFERGISRPKKTYFLNRDFNFVKKDKNIFDYKGVIENYTGIQKGLQGNHQFENASIAICCTEVLRLCGYKIAKRAIYSGIKKAYISGRAELLKSSKWPSNVLVDIAHNIGGVRALKEHVMQNCNYRNLYIILGIMADKDYVNMSKEISILHGHVTLVKPKYYRAWDISDIQKVLKLTNGKIIEDIQEAILGNLEKAKKDDLICLTGSVYTVSEGFRCLKKEGFKRIIS